MDFVLDLVFLESQSNSKVYNRRTLLFYSIYYILGQFELQVVLYIFYLVISIL
jgi:hypothetical protein